MSWVKYEYDAENRIQIVKKDDTNQTLLQSFQYGSTNARLIDYDATAGLNKFYASIGGTVLAEYTEFTSLVFTWTKSYVYLGDSQLSTITPNGTGGEYTEYNHPDRLGTRVITNQASGTSYEQAHLPFGRPLDAESTITNNNKRFTSYDRSARTGLDYAINRTYDSKQGRFTQVDPIDMEAVDAMNPQTLNFYTYCGNDPVNHVDPDGLFWGAIGRFFKKLFTNKWFLIAISVALAVITVGAGLGLWSLNGVVIKSVSIMGYTLVAMTLSVPIVQITVLGWVTLGLAAAAAIPALTSFKGILKLITGFAVGSINSSIFPVSGGGTPDWNPDAGGNNSQQPGRRVRRSTRRTGRGSWVDGWRPVRIPPRYRGPSRAYPRDYPTKDTVNRSAYFRTEGEAMFEASRILGPFPQKIETGKTRSLNGRWQHRAKPGDIFQNHIHLERLDPATERVLENWHYRWPASGSRR